MGVLVTRSIMTAATGQVNTVTREYPTRGDALEDSDGYWCGQFFWTTVHDFATKREGE